MTHKLERFVDALEVYTNPSVLDKIADNNTQLSKECVDLQHKYNILLDDAECVLGYFLDKEDLDPNRESTMLRFLSGAVSEPPRYTKKDFLVAYERLVKTIQASYEEGNNE